MDKNEFLSELEKSLSVLQEDELRDIISEYEQHIDIKVEKGLTEAEAIADFGSLQELTAEILEAYHVRVDYAAETGKSRKKPGKNNGQERPENFNRLKEIGEKGTFPLGDGMKNVGIWIVGSLKWGWRQLCRPFAWLYSLAAAHSPWGEEPDGERTERVSAAVSASDTDALERGMTAGESGEPGGDRTVREKGGKRRYSQKRRGDGMMTGKAVMRDGGDMAGAGVKAVGRGVSRIFRWAIEAALWGIRLVWNGCWIMFSVFAGGFGLFSLFGVGLLAVLLIEGYPLVGVMVGCVGVVFCMFSAAGLGMTLLWRRNKGESAAGTEAAEKNRKEKPESSRRRVHRPGYVLETDRIEKTQDAERDEVQKEKGDEQDA